jgi:PPK2 family polyphosphate:nucleotide phosphotransferase
MKSLLLTLLMASSAWADSRSTAIEGINIPSVPIGIGALESNFPVIPSIPDLAKLPILNEPAIVGASLVEPFAAKRVERGNLAIPVLRKAGADSQAKPGAAFTEKTFSKIFDGLTKYRAPQVEEGVDLSAIDPADTGKIDGKKEAVRKLEKDQGKIDELQQTLYAEKKHKVLIVLQGMDTSGKDGVVKHVMKSLNPQGVVVTSFKQPTQEEKSHHFLWRVAKALPEKGMIGVFNRSQYEDILVPSVYQDKKLNNKEIEARYGTINTFEKELAEKGWTIMKFFLHISKDEQKNRLQERIDNPAKNWKFDASDLKARKAWPQFMKVYEKILTRTNTPWAPWYIIPADKKWYRDYLIGKIVKKTLKSLDMKTPPANPALKKLKIPD